MATPYQDNVEYPTPYEDHECHHANRFNNRGVDTCKDCGSEYDETTMEWINNA